MTMNLLSMRSSPLLILFCVLIWAASILPCSPPFVLFSLWLTIIQLPSLLLNKLFYKINLDSCCFHLPKATSRVVTYTQTSFWEKKNLLAFSVSPPWGSFHHLKHLYPQWVATPVLRHTWRGNDNSGTNNSNFSYVVKTRPHTSAGQTNND